MTNSNNLKGVFPIEEQHKTVDFDCGIEVLNTYLKKHAFQNHHNNSSKTYVALTGENTVIGYFSLAYGSVGYEEAPSRISRGLGQYPIPILVLARFAVDNTFKGKGLGRALLKQALLKALRASEIAGLRAVVVHAKDENVRSFYERFGFSQSPIDEMHLFLLLKDIKKSVSD